MYAVGFLFGAHMNVRQKRAKHATKRAKQRYGLSLNHADRKNIEMMIRKGITKCIKAYTNSKKLHMIDYKEEKIFVIYSNSTASIVTILPKDCKEYKEYLNGIKQKTETHTEENGWKTSDLDNRFNVEFAERMLDMQDSL
jgi:hypothetical protein